MGFKMRKIAEEVKQEAIRLRIEERLGIDDIRHRTGLSVGTLSVLLRDYPLSKEEVFEKMSQSSLRNNPLRKYLPPVSGFARQLEGEKLGTGRKGRIAEAAVALRLARLGYEIWRSMFEGSKVDFAVTRPASQRFIRLQVKWARRAKYGRPHVTIPNGEGKKVRHFKREYSDFIVAYDMESDTAFVLPAEVCEGKWNKSCDEEYAEAWHLLGI